MTSNSFRVLAALSLVVFAFAPVPRADAEIEAEVIQRAFERIEPALCLLSYTVEITNPQTNEPSRQNMQALGLLVTPDGLVLANGHMVHDFSKPSNVQVTVGEGDNEAQYEATLLEKPSDVNVTFLRIQHDGSATFPYVTLDASSAPKLGDPVAIVGILGDNVDFARSIQVRYISGILKEPRLTFLLDQPAPFGFVGGPAIDQRGRIVGVLGFDLTTAQGGDIYSRSGHPLLFQSALLAPYVAEPPGDSGSESNEAYMGVLTQPLTDDFAEYWNLPKRGGVIVATIVAGSPADLAGLRRGDVIVRVKDTVVNAKRDADVRAFTRLVQDSGIGVPVPIQILRNGEPLELTLTLARRPTTAARAVEFEDEVFGVTVREITQDVRLMINLPADVEGVIVTRVRPGSWAQIAGMQLGVIIMRMGEHPVSSIDEYKAAVASITEAKPTEVPVFCRLGPHTGYFRLQPKW